jgi:hypothetical protein
MTFHADRDSREGRREWWIGLIGEARSIAERQPHAVGLLRGRAAGVPQSSPVRLTDQGSTHAAADSAILPSRSVDRLAGPREASPFGRGERKRRGT